VKEKAQDFRKKKGSLKRGEKIEVRDMSERGKFNFFRPGGEADWDRYRRPRDLEGKKRGTSCKEKTKKKASSYIYEDTQRS